MIVEVGTGGGGWHGSASFAPSFGVSFQGTWRSQRHLAGCKYCGGGGKVSVLHNQWSNPSSIMSSTEIPLLKRSLMECLNGCFSQSLVFYAIANYFRKNLESGLDESEYFFLLVMKSERETIVLWSTQCPCTCTPTNVSPQLHFVVCTLVSLLKVDSLHRTRSFHVEEVFFLVSKSKVFSSPFVPDSSASIATFYIVAFRWWASVPCFTLFPIASSINTVRW